MISRRVVAPLGSKAASAALIRPFCSTRWVQKSPALSDVQPDQGHVFDARQKAFREELAEAGRKKKEQERQSAASSNGADKSESPASSVTEYLDSAGMGSLSLSAGEAQQRQEGQEDNGKKKNPISSLLYGTEEGKQLDRDIERSFSQVLARGKYVHSIVFHDVKPDKVDEYVDLVGSWYPRMAGMPENKVHLVGSWRTEVGDCDTFGMSLTTKDGGVCCVRFADPKRSGQSTSGSTSAIPATTPRFMPSRITLSSPNSTAS